MGDVSAAPKEIIMTPTRYPFMKANWHAAIFGKPQERSLEFVPVADVDGLDIPDAFEFSLVARKSAAGRTKDFSWSS